MAHGQGVLVSGFRDGPTGSLKGCYRVSSSTKAVEICGNRKKFKSKIGKERTRSKFLGLGAPVSEGRPGRNFHKRRIYRWIHSQQICSRMRVANSKPEQSARRADHNRKLNQLRFGNTVQKIWYGETVRIPKNGDLRIFVSSSRPALLLRLGKTF